jgi:histidinol-phosphate aminotransferase
MIEPRKAIKKMRPYNPPLEGRRNKVRLDFNENTGGCSPGVLESLRNTESEEVAAYPEYNVLLQKLSEWLKVPEGNILITNATDEAIMVTCQTFIESGEKILLPVPTYSMFRVYGEISGAEILEIPYNEDLSFPCQRFLQNLEPGIRMAVVVNPNNPTGTPVTREDFMQIMEKSRDAGILVLLDQAYTQFCSQDHASLYKEYDNLLVIQTFSKAFGMAGLRMGYIVARDYLISHLKKVRSPYSISTLAATAAVSALEDNEFIDNYVKEVKASGREIIEFLKQRKIKVFPTEANFVLARFGERAGKIQDALREKGILVRDRSGDTMLEGCIRITFGTREQTRRLLRCLDNIL